MRSLLTSSHLALGQLEVLSDLSLARREVSTAWERYRESTIKRFRDGLDFGRVCHGWRARYKAQGSRNGRGFEQLLEQLSIPKTTAYRWITRFEMKNGLRANRNEVKNNPSRVHIQSASHLLVVERISFEFLLTDEQREQFEENVKILGGHKEIAKMFFAFVSEKAREKRAAHVPHTAKMKLAQPPYSDARTIMECNPVAKFVGISPQAS
jgi:hypothetical protein